jgi:mono/diheme cytochrome c family protein
MIPARMSTTPAKKLTVLLAAAGAIATLSACGEASIEVSADASPRVQEGARLFYERCSGCHTFKKANAYGSKPTGQLQGGERTNGPNFDVRHVKRDDALFAIRNGGFSGAIMPANVVTGKDADAVADFLDKYSGKSE